MDYILSGNPKDVEKVIQENRIRVQRGVINFTPLEADAIPCEELHTSDESEVESLKSQLEEMGRTYTAMSEELSNACFRASQAEDTIRRIREAGVDIDLILDTPTVATDVKDEPEADTKAEPEADGKVEPEVDAKPTKAEHTADTKTTKPKRTKKTK